MPAAKMNCPHCAKPIGFPPEKSGSRVKCPGCQKPVTLATAPPSKESKPPQPVTMDCPKCSATLRTPPASRGKLTDCPECGVRLTVPTGSADVVAAELVAAGKKVAAASGEETLWRGTPSVFKQAPGTILAMTAVFWIVIPIGLGYAPLAAKWIWIGRGVSGSILALPLLYDFIVNRFRVLTVTNRRVTYQVGVLSRDVSEVRIGDIRNVQVSQSILARILGCGNLAISSSGQGGFEIIAAGISRPANVAKIIRDQQN